MSDPVTNIEIEDVLSSIRRLVSDGDKATTRDRAPFEVEAQADPDEDIFTSDTPESGEVVRPEKLVLTPAFMVLGLEEDDEAAQAAPAEVETTAEQVLQSEDFEDKGDQRDDAEEDVTEQSLSDDSEVEYAQPESGGVEPFILEQPAKEAPSEAVRPDLSDRSALVATIAELEAAVGSDAEEYDPDGSETVHETIEWPGSIAGRFDVAAAEAKAEDAETVDDVQSGSASVEEIQFHTARVDNGEPAPEAGTNGVREAAAEPDEHPQNDIPIAEAGLESDDLYADDDDLDGLLDLGGDFDEEALKDLVAEVVRAELSGPLGERITRNVRKMVRREIYRILSSKDFD